MGARPFTPPARGRAAAETTEREAPSSKSGLKGRGREAAALLLFAVATFLALALASYRVDPRDPTITGSDWVGPVGASVAGVLVQGFGLVAWFAPLELALVGVPLLRGRAPGPVGTRVAGDLIVAIVLSALVHVALPDLSVFGRAS